MFTLCEKCRTVYRIHAAQLRQGGGEAVCDRCKLSFSALEHLGDSIDETLSSPTSCLLELPKLNHENAVATAHEIYATGSAPEPPEKDNKNQEPEAPPLDPFTHPRNPLQINQFTLYWRLGAIGLVLLLLAQLIYFEADRWAQNAHLRPPLEVICHWLGCTLPPFQNVADIEVVDRSLYPARNSIDGYEFHLVMVNHAPYPQPYPLLKLSLTALDGTLIAQRIFKPGEYLKKPTFLLMPSHRMIFVQLEFAAPDREVGGFQVEFLH